MKTGKQILERDAKEQSHARIGNVLENNISQKGEETRAKIEA